MQATLTIHHDGDLVYQDTITKADQVFEALEMFRPPQARGSVAMLTAKGYAADVWTSGHSITGAIWIRHS